MWHWQNDSLARILSADAAFDLCVLQKILPKIAGTGEALLQALGNLADWLNETRRSTETPDSSEFTEIPLGSFERSAAKVGRMLRRLEIEGVTTYWGT
jgi:hypothetical protein